MRLLFIMNNSGTFFNVFTAVTSLCCANSTARDKPTYPVPAAVIFFVNIQFYLLNSIELLIPLRKVSKSCS